MSGISSGAILGPILRHWPYRLVFFLAGAAALRLLARKGLSNSGPTGLRRFSHLLPLGGQCLAVAATVIFVEWNLGWRVHPTLLAQNNWIDSFWHFFVDDFFSEVALGLSVLALIHIGDVTRESLGIRLPTLAGSVAAKSRKSSAALLVIGMVSAYAMLHFIAGPTARALGTKISGGSAAVGRVDLSVWVVRQTAEQIGTFGVPLFLLWDGLLVPIIEEAFFRGFYFNALLKETSASIALITQALFFAPMHVDLPRLPYLFVLGLTLGYLVKRTSSLLPAVLLHVAINMSAMLSVLR